MTGIFRRFSRGLAETLGVLKLSPTIKNVMVGICVSFKSAIRRIKGTEDGKK